MKIETPYYLIDERRLLRNLKIIKRIRRASGAKAVLALKCFSTWSVFALIRQYMDGTTASSVYEARLGYEKFGKETQVYSPGYSDRDVRELSKYCGKIIFNSVSQLKKFRSHCGRCKIGLRLNPGKSFSHFDLADPCRKHSRLGAIGTNPLKAALPLISGAAFHFNCENDDFGNFSANLDRIGRIYGRFLKKLEWVSLGGGVYFTLKGYPVKDLCRKLGEFGRSFGVQVYLEPGESVVTGAGELVTSVLDIVHNGMDIAIVDASIEAHMSDLLIYRTPAKIRTQGRGRFTYTIAGRSCLAGDIFGTCSFPRRLRVGSTVRISDAAGYTMVKKNWFNGLKMPSIAVKRLDGRLDVVRRFDYSDFARSLS